MEMDAEGIASGWYIGVSQYKLWKSNRPRLCWKDATALLQHPPAFLPPTLIAVEGKENGELIGHALPTCTTNWREAIVYMADHVDPSVIDENMEKLIRKSRERVDRERASPRRRVGQ
jgi:hypothetical protein